ncbi:hypothetical protein OAL25_00650 [bacterium]|jgi:hypothetical protein|nr:hypothetical protein [bacterium]
MTAQFERLNQDVVELETYIQKLKERKRVDKGLIGKLVEKKRFLINHITEKQLLMQ